MAEWWAVNVDGMPRKWDDTNVLPESPPAYRTENRLEN